jgi:NADPH-dependent F420 reductase
MNRSDDRMRIGVIGTGHMGSTLAELWARAGHDVLLGSREPQQARDMVEQIAARGGPPMRSGSYADAGAHGDVILLATPFFAAAEAVVAAGDLRGKILIDCTNPIAEGGEMLSVGRTISAAEQIASWAQGARVVKALNAMGFETLPQPRFGDQTACTFVCGNDHEARAIVMRLAEDIGLDAIDAGPLTEARTLEPLALLWIHLSRRLPQGRGIAFALLRREMPSGTER